MFAWKIFSISQVKHSFYDFSQCKELDKVISNGMGKVKFEKTKTSTIGVLFSVTYHPLLKPLSNIRGGGGVENGRTLQIDIKILTKQYTHICF